MVHSVRFNDSVSSCSNATLRFVMWTWRFYNWKTSGSSSRNIRRRPRTIQNSSSSLTCRTVWKRNPSSQRSTFTLSGSGAVLDPPCSLLLTFLQLCVRFWMRSSQFVKQNPEQDRDHLPDFVLYFDAMLEPQWYCFLHQSRGNLNATYLKHHLFNI